MSAQFMDNFSFYGTSTARMLDGLPWASVSGTLVADPDPSASGKVYEPFSNTSSSLSGSDRIALPSPQSVVGVALRWWMSALPSGTGVRPILARFATAANSSIAILTVEPNGALSVYKLDASGESVNDLVLVETTTAPVVAPNSWFHYEIKYSDTGDYEVRIEGGDAVLTGTASSPRAGPVGIIGFSRSMSTGGVASYMKDLIIWDNQGSVANDFFGTCTVFGGPPNSDVSSGWSKSTGTSDYALIDETTPDDTDYIYAGSTLPAASIVGITNLPSDITTVKSVMTVVRAKKSDGGDGKLQPSLVSSGDKGAGAEHNVTTTFKYWIDVHDLDPHTATAWSPISFNAANLEMDRTL